MTNQHNTNALLLGTAEFSFAEGAVTLAEGRVIGFRDLGNMTTFSLQPETTKVEHKGSYRGTKRTDRVRVTESKLVYQLKLDEWTLQNLLFLFYANRKTSADFTQALSAAVAADTMVFTALAPAIPGHWYDISKSGVRVRAISAWVWGTKIAGTDYELDAALGRVRFMAEQVADVESTVSAPAIIATDKLSMKALEPLVNTKRSGIGRLIVFDDNSVNQVAMEHDAFGCDITLTGNVEGGSDNFTEYTLEVLVTSPVGVVLAREVGGGMV